MSSSTTSRLGSQKNSRCPSSSRTSTAAYSELPQHSWIVPYIPANSVFQCPSLTRTTVPLRASYAFKMIPPSLVGARTNLQPRPDPKLVSPFSNHRAYYGTTPFYVFSDTGGDQEGVPLLPNATGPLALTAVR